MTINKCKLFSCELTGYGLGTRTHVMKISLGWVAQAELRLLYQFLMPAANFHHTIVLPSRYEQLPGSLRCLLVGFSEIFWDGFGSFLGVRGSCYAYGRTVPYLLKS